MIPGARRLLDWDNRRRGLRRWRARRPRLYRATAGLLFGRLRRRELHVRRSSGLGDVLLCTPALREVRRRWPGRRILLYTDFAELVRGLPYLDEVRPSAECPPGATLLTYEECVPPTRHVARLIGELLGVTVTDLRPDCVVDPATDARWAARLGGLRRPVLVVHRRAAAWTPNKDWPAAAWSALLPELCRLGSVVEIGTAAPDDPGPDHPDYHDLRGQTSLSDLPALLKHADLHLGPDSGPMHLAAAVGCPAVVLFGGYTHSAQVGYADHTNLDAVVECAACWLRTPCPIGLHCLTGITPAQVLDAVVERLGRAWPGS